MAPRKKLSKRPGCSPIRRSSTKTESQRKRLLRGEIFRRQRDVGVRPALVEAGLRLCSLLRFALCAKAFREAEQRARIFGIAFEILAINRLGERGLLVRQQ